MDGTKRDIAAYETGPSPDFDEFTFGAGELDVSSIGGYPVRQIRIVTAGAGALAIRTVGSGATNRTLTGLAAGENLFPGQITSIRGTGDGTSVTRIRVYK